MKWDEGNPTGHELRIVSEMMLPGVSVSSVARRHGLHPNQVFSMRMQARAGELTGGERAASVSVSLQAETGTSRAATVANLSERRSTIEFVLGNGRGIRAEAGIASDLLARLAAALERA
jgi:transposase-like protein